MKISVALVLILSIINNTCFAQQAKSSTHPNIIIIYADDLGYGDLSCYGATKINTPNIDNLANKGLRFTNAHCTASTCTPSRFSLLTGEYAWRKKGTNILPGDASLIIPLNHATLPSVLKKAGYTTACIGKWHLGLGEQNKPDWNGEIKPGPNEVGFDYAFFFPATADRVPTVFIENHNVVGLDTADRIEVNYDHKIGNDPTGKEHPELLKMKASPGQGHDGTIVNGIGRIGFMSGGIKARWVDEELEDVFVSQAQHFIETNKQHPFFLYLALTDIHVPRMPETRFKGKSILGYRGDAILQIDNAVGEVMKTLNYLGLDKNTLVIFSSDNGPVLNDGYEDGAVEMLNGHKPAGALRGGKYSVLEGGTRIPFIVYWPAVVKKGVSNALISQVDLLSSFASLTHQKLKVDDGPDSHNMINTLTGKSFADRPDFVEQGGALAYIQNNWKYIEPHDGPAIFSGVNIETGFNQKPQLYNLKEDAGEKNNLADKHPEMIAQMAKKLEAIKKNESSNN